MIKKHLLLKLTPKALPKRHMPVCPKCKSDDIDETFDYDESVYMCRKCGCEFDENGISKG